MASVKKRGDSYRIFVSNGYRCDGSKIVETMTYTPEPGMTKRQIERKLEEVKVDFERHVRSGQATKGEKMSLKELAELYMKDMKPTGNEDTDKISITSWSNYKITLRLRIIPKLGHIKIGSIIKKTLNDYAKALRVDGARSDGKPGGLSEATIHKDCCLVSAMLSYAVEEGLLEINPILYARRQSRAHKTRKEYKVDYFTVEQTKAFLWALDNPIGIRHKAHDRVHKNGKVYHVPEYFQEWTLPLEWRAYFYLALFVGDRRGENISLTWEDIDFQTGEVRITKSTAYAERKIYHKSTKTYQSRFPIIPDVVINILKLWKIEQKQMCVKLGTYWQGFRGSDFDKNFIFTQDSGKQVHPSTPYHVFKKIIRIYNDNVAKNEKDKLPPNATQHDLRHTAASILITNGMDPRSVAGVLGHANPTTTLNIYSYFFRSKNRDAADIMNNTLNPQKNAIVTK